MSRSSCASQIFYILQQDYFFNEVQISKTKIPGLVSKVCHFAPRAQPQFSKPGGSVGSCLVFSHGQQGASKPPSWTWLSVPEDVAENGQEGHLYSPQSEMGLPSWPQGVHRTKGSTLGMRETSTRSHVPMEMVGCVVLHCHLVESSHWRPVEKDGWLISCGLPEPLPTTVCPRLAEHWGPSCDPMGHYILQLLLLQGVKHRSTMQGLEVLCMGNTIPLIQHLDLQVWY